MSEPSPPPAAPSDPDLGTDLDRGSFRDPGGRVFESDGVIHRTLDTRALANWQRLSTTTFFAEAVGRGDIVGTELADPSLSAGVPGEWAGVLRHDRIPVISYPYEWTFSMLRAAALLQLDLLAAALEEDMILKDSTPYNVQWRGSKPVFIDVGSFEPLEEGDVWVGYRQFLRQYLYPLMLRTYVDVPFQPWLRGEPEGLTAEQLHRMLPSRHRLRKSVLLHVGMQARAERRYRDSDRDVRSELKEAGFRKELIQANVSGLRKTVEGLEWGEQRSEWNRYDECGHVATQRGAKTEFLTEFLATHRPSTVWDVGANDGHFSKAAAAVADYVLALDADELVLDELFGDLTAQGVGNVLPLLQDMASPSPGLGWRGAERPPLPGRSHPDLVMCFAVIHHLVVGRNLPLRDVIDWLADLDTRVILEFVPPDDPMVLRLAANKRPHEIHADYTEAALRHYLSDRFVIEREAAVPDGGRHLFALRPLG